MRALLAGPRSSLPDRARPRSPLRSRRHVRCTAAVTDADAAPPGTATLRGHVFAADTGQPLRKAQVRIIAGEIRENRMATTDARAAPTSSRKCARVDTPSSRARAATSSVSYGQQRPTDAAKPLEILDHQTVERVDLDAAARRRDHGPHRRRVRRADAPDVQVATQRYQVVQGQRRLVPAGRSAIDQRHRRIPTVRDSARAVLPLGDVAQHERLQPELTARASDGLRARCTFPAPTNRGEAQRVTVSAGQQIDDLVMVLKPTRPRGSAAPRPVPTASR